MLREVPLAKFLTIGAVLLMPPMVTVEPVRAVLVSAFHTRIVTSVYKKSIFNKIDLVCFILCLLIFLC